MTEVMKEEKRERVILKKDSIITLMRSGDKENATTVYLTESERNGEVIIINNLEFYLYLAIPLSLDANLLYLEMLRSYHNEQCGEWRLARMNEEIGELEEEIDRMESGVEERYRELYSVVLSRRRIVRGKEDIIPEKYQTMYQIYLSQGKSAMLRQWREREKTTQQMIEKKRQLRLLKMKELERHRELNSVFQRFTSEMKLTNYVQDSLQRMVYLKEKMGSDFLIIQEMTSFTLPATAAAMAKKFSPKKATLLRMKFDNHTILRHFLSKFRSPLKMREYHSHYSEVDDEMKYKSEQKEYAVIILTDATKTAAIYAPRENVHDEYIMKQTFQFSHPEHLYCWSLPSTAFLSSVEEKRQFTPMSQTLQLQNSEVFGSLEELKKGLFQRRLTTSHVMINTLHFEFSLDHQICTVDGKLCRENVVILDTRVPQREKSCEMSGRMRVEKPIVIEENRNSVKKKSFYSLSKGDTGRKPLKQQSLSFFTLQKNQ